MYRIELGKDYRVRINDEAVKGFFIHDSCGEVDFPYLFIARATYQALNGFPFIEEAMDDIIDYKTEIAKVISEHSKRRLLAVFEVDQADNTCGFDLDVDIDEDWCTAFHLDNCSDDEIFGIKRICNAFDIEIDWRK